MENTGHGVTVDNNVKPLTHNPDIDGAQPINRQPCVPERKALPLPTKIVLNQHRTVALKHNGAIFGWLEPGKEGWHMKIDNDTVHPPAKNIRFSNLEGKKKVEFEVDKRHQTYEFSPVIPSYTIATLSQPGE